MTTSILSQGRPSPHPDNYSIKEFQLLVRDTPVVPAEIQPFVGIQYTSSNQVYQAFQHLASMPVETFVVVHLDGKNRMVGMTTCSIGSMTASLVHPRDVFRPAIANLTAGLILIHNHPSSTRLLSLWKTSSNTSTSGSCHNRLPIHLISAPFRSLHPFSSSLFLGLHLKGNSYSRENGKGRFTHFIYHQVPAAVSLRTNRLRRFGPPWTTINAIKLVPVMKPFFCKFGPYGR